MHAAEWVRIVSLCVMLAAAETLHGIARTAWLAPRIGKSLATRLSIVSGSAIAFVLCCLFVPPIGLAGFPPHLLLGLGLALFMAAFDITLGRLLLRLPWKRIWRDFNPGSGNYLSIGLLLLALMPAAVWGLAIR